MNVTQFGINLAKYVCMPSVSATHSKLWWAFCSWLYKTLPLQMEGMYHVTRRDSAKFAAISGKETHGFSL